MTFKQLLIASSFLSFAAMAKPPLTITLPNCLEQALKAPHALLAKNTTTSVIELQTSDVDQLAVLKQQKKCGGFKDVSRKRLKESPKALLKSLTSVSSKKSGYEVKHRELAHELLSQIEPNNIWDTLTHLTSYNDRYANSDTGVAAAKWLKSHFEDMVKAAHRDDVNTYLVGTGWWYSQPSVVTVVGANLNSDAIVISAHMDTLHYNKPGADDDGSGSASITEAARVILNSGKRFKHPIYFVWYAAEEEGLVGSQYVVSDFLAKRTAVKAVLHMDMTGYRYQGQDKMWVLTDNVNTSLTKYLQTLITEYVGVDVGETRCGYACSDHASWNDEGFIASATAEGKFGDDDPYIHTENDTMDHVSLAHMTNYTRLAVAFMAELASE